MQSRFFYSWLQEQTGGLGVFCGVDGSPRSEGNARRKTQRCLQFCDKILQFADLAFQVRHIALSGGDSSFTLKQVSDQPIQSINKSTNQ